MFLENNYKMTQEQFTKYERARIIGARGLQISMDAPLLLKLSEKELEEMNYDPLKIAEKELENNVLPISVKRPMPERKEEDIEKIKVEDNNQTDEEKIKTEEAEEKDIAQSGEMNEIIDTPDELESDGDIGSEGASGGDGGAD